MITAVVDDDTSRARRLVGASAALTVLIGLVFIFIRAPHPFGWEGIDHYHDLALQLARGEAFPTTDVPWGYAYFLAIFYRAAGDRPWVPLVAQALLNGLVPILLYVLVRDELDRRTAVVAALLASVLSFNTVYASTQSSDSVCTVLFLASMTAFAAALRGRGALFVPAGVLAGIAAQFRPNLILFPVAAAAAAALLQRHPRARASDLVAYVAAAGLIAVPWTVRNYRLTGELIPTSTHGGVQLWYGTLQTGATIDSRAHNPRSFFEAPAFDYTSLAGRPLVVTASRPCEPSPAHAIFWTDRDPVPRRAAPAEAPDASTIAFTMPGQPDPTAVYFYLSVARPDGGHELTPTRGADDPFVFFVDDRHLEDLDRHRDLLDAFDVVRVLRAIGFHEPIDDARLDLTRDGRIDEGDFRAIVSMLLDGPGAKGADRVAAVDVAADAVTARFVDGSALTVPRAWSHRITDLSVTEGVAARLVYERRPMRALTPQPRPSDGCRALERVRVNDVFYRREPHWMRRYTALAWDNIRRAPAAFAAASLYRAVRLFVIEGTSDRSTNWQFAGSRVVYPLATAASVAYALAGAAGLAVAVRRRRRVWLLLLPVVYVPATICFVLTNMRYTITVQPFVLAFVAVALTARARAGAPSGIPAASRPS